MRENSLPIHEIEQQIVQVMREHPAAVLVAPTGSGKTTQVPQMLLDHGLAGDKRIVVLQPRRVAARTVAARVAHERGCRLGTEVGYQIRFEDATSVGTRISYITEGILLRQLQQDPTLNSIACVLFDEFHERNLLSDVALALVKRLQQTTRPDLKLMVMSATLEAEPVADYLASTTATDKSPRGATPILVSEGISFPVQVRFLDQHDERPATEQAADAVNAILGTGEPGDILVFMPGMGEINSTIRSLQTISRGESLAFIPLHGDLPSDQQDLAFAPNSRRKVVIATNVAETSVTIPGIRHVVDSGLARVARYDAERGVGTLFLEPISRASADQRKGRAGRTAPGTCYRLWTESGHLNRPERNTPEIQRSDLAEVVLLLHSMGVPRAADFDWLDKPDPAAVERAEKLLINLGALKRIGAGPEASDSTITPVGRQMLRLPMHPRYSRMLVEAAKYQCLPAASLCAALVSGRDLLARLNRDDKHIKEARELFEGSQESDFYTLMRAFQFAKKNQFSPDTCRRYGVHAQTARQVEQTCEQILELAQKQFARNQEAAKPTGELGGQNERADDHLLRCLMTGFIDQLGLRRDQGTLECFLTEGRQGTLVRESVVQNSPLFVAANIREVASHGSENLTLLSLATAVKREWVEESFPDQITAKVEHVYDRTHKRVAAVKVTRFHDLIINHEHQKEVDPVSSGRVLAEAHRKEYFELPLFNHEVKQWIGRVNLASAVMPEMEIPIFDETAIVNCLAKAFSGLTLAKEAIATPLRDVFRAFLPREQVQWIDELCPGTVPWPDGRKIKLLYAEASRDEDGEPASPEMQMKLSECFALQQHPHICEGRLPVRLWVCAPDGKRLDSTFNWISFKQLGYPKLRSSLLKKYPGNAWP